MYYLYGRINQGHKICLLYGGCPLFGESVIRGFTLSTCAGDTRSLIFNFAGRERELLAFLLL